MYACTYKYITFLNEKRNILIWYFIIFCFSSKVTQERNPSEFAVIAEYVLVKFFSWTGGTLVYYRRDMDPIIYARIWKCANEGIGMNLHTMISGQGTPLSKALVHEAKTLGVYFIRMLS